MTNQGYIKAVPTEDIREQGRGGRGRTGMALRDNDGVRSSLFCSNKDTLMFFTSKGLVYSLNAWEIVEGDLSSKGRFIANYLDNLNDDSVTDVIVKPSDPKNKSIIFVTNQGTVRRNRMDLFDNINSNGKIAMKLPDDTKLVSVFIADDDVSDIFLYANNGHACRFQLSDDSIRAMENRNSVGIRGMRVDDGEEVIGGLRVQHFDFSVEEREAYEAGQINSERQAEFNAHHQWILTLTADGFAKRFSSHDVRITNRGAKGVNILSSKSKLILCRVVGDDDSISLTTNTGTTIRIPAMSVRQTGRNAKGVRVLKLDKGVSITACSVVAKMDEDSENALQ